MRKQLLTWLVAAIATAATFLCAAIPASAQSTSNILIVSSCGNQSLNAGTAYLGIFTVDTTGKLCVNASLSASITGFPGTSQTTGTPIAVTTSGVTGTLPAGAEVVASNVGSTNTAYCKLGTSATTSDQMIPPNSWFGFTVGSNTQLTCITSTSTTTVNMVGGSGLPTGAGGGGGGGGSGGNVNLTEILGAAPSATNPLWMSPATGATFPVSASSLPLPTGAATSANQTNKTQSTQLTDGTNVATTYTSYGTAPSGLVPGANVFVTNSNANGQAAASASSPVVLASNQPVSNANSSVAINISTATTTQLVALSGTTKIYVTSWDVIAGGTGNITLEYGTGTACATGTTVLTGAYNLVAQAGISKGDGAAPVLVVPAGNALCALTSAAVQMSGSLTYQQF